MPTFFHSVQDFNALNYLWMTLKSPMILMALGAWALTSFLPKLTVSIDSSRLRTSHQVLLTLPFDACTLIQASLEPEEAAQLSQAQSEMMGKIQSGDYKGAVSAAASGGNGATGAQVGAGSQAKKRK